ncbi:MAG: glutamate--cysteine ligase [Deltaproteobacteria bacterium]
MNSTQKELKGEWIASLLRSHIRSPSQRRVGIEIERIGIWEDLTPLQYSDRKLNDGKIRPGAMSFLKKLSKDHQWPTINNSQGKPLGLTTTIGKVTLEPGSQVELSTEPFVDLITIQEKVDHFEKQIAEVTGQWGLNWVGLGVNPIHTVNEIELIPSSRYAIMDKFLSHRGTLGTSMMRRTSSVQVNLDYTSEEEAIEMLRVSLLVAPVSYALFSNSPFCEGKETGFQSFRGKIWQETDPARTGLLPEVFREGFNFNDYGHYLWNEPLMFVQDSKNEYHSGQGFSLIEIEQGKLPGISCSEANQLNAMRELFSEARIKLGYVEVRSIDGLLPEYRYAASAFWLGILYSDIARKEVFKLLGSLSANNRQELFNSSIRLGLKAQCCHLNLKTVAQRLLEVAESELKSRGFGEEKLLEPLKINLASGHNPASILLERFRKDWNGDITQVIRETIQN